MVLAVVAMACCCCCLLLLRVAVLRNAVYFQEYLDGLPTSSPGVSVFVGAISCNVFNIVFCTDYSSSGQQQAAAAAATARGPF